MIGLGHTGVDTESASSHTSGQWKGGVTVLKLCGDTVCVTRQYSSPVCAGLRLAIRVKV